MSNETMELGARAEWAPRPAFVDRVARGAIFAGLGALKRGRIEVAERGRLSVHGDRGEGALRARVEIRDASAWRAIAFGGTVGAGEAYMRGEWACDDLVALVRIFTLNRDMMDGMERGLARLAAPFNKLLHFARRNTRSGSRKNIAAHYDLGNDFFRLFLDESMMYSSAVFESEGMNLSDAQWAKNERICRKLKLRPTDHLLEIGTGWGGFAIHAAKHHGCRVTTTTLSKEQRAMAMERIKAEGLEGRIEVLLEDYRDLRGSYDKLVSIEMIEAVGHEFFDHYFEACGRLLKPEGLMCLQAITIADQLYESARRSVDFIQKHIFPGGSLPSVSRIAEGVARRTDLRMTHLEDIGPHYATTLRRWRERFFANLDAIRALGYPEEFLRMWEFYLCYCEGGFLERAIGTVQAVFAKPMNRDAAV